MFKSNLPRLLVVLFLVTAVKSVSAEVNLPDLVRRVKPSVVAIVTFDEKGESLATGSGFFVHQDQILTNLHVMRGAYRAEIRTLDVKGRGIRWRACWVWMRRGLAVECQDAFPTRASSGNDHFITG